MSVKRNIIANLGGSAWSALMGLAFVPVYIKLMGVESYALVGVYIALTGVLAILDMGLSQSMTREMARLSADENNASLQADTARTLELIYWVIALGVVVVMVLLSDFIAYHWLSPEHLSRETLRQSLWIMAMVIGLRWPIALYLGGLNGLQRQVRANIILAIFATLQGGGALAVLWFIEPTILAFFSWQAVIALLNAIVLRTALWNSFPGMHAGAFRKEILQNIWRFAAGMSGISLVATVLTQLDKIMLSKMLSLTEFGYYTFAATVAGVIFRIIGPIFIAYQPRLTELVSRSDRLALVKAYHQGAQLMAVAILPATLVLAFFSREILELWTQNPDVVQNASLLTSLLVIGNALNGLMHIPYALQLAHGWTRLAFYQNVIAVSVLVPALYWATQHWGATGAASVWIVLNTGYILIGISVMHRRLLAAEKWRWYMYDTGKPFLLVLAATGAAKSLVPENAGALGMAFIIGVVLLLSYVVAVFGADTLRVRILSKRPVGDHQ